MPRHGKLDYPPDERYSDNIFSTHAGGYSVARINIAIGIIGIFVFSILNGIHFGNYLSSLNFGLSNFQCAMLGIAQVILIFGSVFYLLKKLCKSGEAK